MVPLTRLGRYPKTSAFFSAVDLGGLSELRDIRQTPTGHSIGSGVLLSDLEAWSESTYPSMAKMLRFFASRQIKNRATIGGNLCNASPIGDLPPVMLGLDAVAVIRSRDGERRVSFGGANPDTEGFWLSYRQTALNAGEVLVGIEIPKVHDETYVSSYKVSKRRELDISAVSNFAIRVDQDNRVEHVRLAYGGMAATPLRAYAVEHQLLGQPLDDAVMTDAVSQMKNRLCADE